MSLTELIEESERFQEWLCKAQEQEPAMKRNNREYELWYELIQHIVMEIEEVSILIKKKLAENAKDFRIKRLKDVSTAVKATPISSQHGDPVTPPAPCRANHGSQSTLCDSL